MAKEEFVNNNLLKIRDKLSSAKNPAGNSDKEAAPTAVAVGANPSLNQGDGKEKPSGPSAIANERDWKKAVFKRWDEFKSVKKDIINRLSERIASLPKEIEQFEGHAEELRHAEEKFRKLLEEINTLDDSQWNRHNFTSELAVGMRKLENARIQFMMQASRTASPATKNTGQISESDSSSKNIIHELTSLSFKQCFRIGFGFFMPLIIAMLAAVVIWGLIYYLSLN